MMKDKGGYPFGRQAWVLGTEASICDYQKDVEVKLTFSKCYNDSYTCDSGHCVPLR